MNNTEYDSKVSEFTSEQQANSYNNWLKNEVEDRLNNSYSVVPHDQVIMKMNALLDSYHILKAA